MGEVRNELGMSMPIIAPKIAPVPIPEYAPLPGPPLAPAVLLTTIPISMPAKAPKITPAVNPIRAPVKSKDRKPVIVPISAPAISPTMPPTTALCRVGMWHLWMPDYGRFLLSKMHFAVWLLLLIFSEGLFLFRKRNNARLPLPIKPRLTSQHRHINTWSVVFLIPAIATSARQVAYPGTVP